MSRDDSQNAGRVILVKEQTVRARIAAAEEELRSIDQRRVELLTVIAANREILGYFGDASAPTENAESDRRRTSIREMLIDVLGEAEKALGVREMIDLIAVRFDRHLVRTSVSPVLSKMEARGLVRHVGTKWIWNRMGSSAGTDDPEDGVE
ncbi:hypothetical protein [Sphingomonas sp. RIT328]|uniref:hypothetical protein n=1 Tax=Sphingomonas sp. RIT328 TaxID=1470591 RepID=UPI00044C7665|nr:hypothetical protein [Sphingomonas sp. RIT328]EZP52704.1 hypothetical protein BW41_02467 [Sphingomonas sp. RIT328]